MRKILLCLGLVLATFIVYAQVRHFDFVNFDDPDYVIRNLHVRGGLTMDGLVWAFTGAHAANWFPLTWISHMEDCQIFGLQAGLHHLKSVALHALAAVMLFAFLFRSTGAQWRSAFVALVFALHPLHVESVAWIAERKDVLSAVSWFAALLAYVWYRERPGHGRYVLVIVLFALGLMAKPMTVTLPLVLLLVDRWPLRRAEPTARLLREKLPLFALSAAGAAVTYLVQQAAGAVKPVDAIPIGTRIGNALISYAVYIAKTFWPSNLAVFYPYPAELPAWQVALSVAQLAAI